MTPHPGAGPAHGTALREQLWSAVRDGDEHTATAAVLAALDAGAGPEAVLLDVIAPVQAEVGAAWAAARISVAEEHIATAVNDRLIAALARHPAGRAEARLGRTTVACVDGEWHALPARLLAEVLRLRGWRVDFLGAQTPTPHLIAHLHRTGPAAVLLSSSIPTRLPTAHAAITACQAAGVPVVVGGAAFGADGRHARRLGADGWAPDARAAADLLARGLPRPSRAGTQPPADGLPHLADQEYTMTVRARHRLVGEVLAGLEQRLPAVRAYTPRQRQHTAEDIAHLVDFLAAALYVDDTALFTDFLCWTADILTARGVPAESLYPALDLLGGRLGDFPRAAARLRQGRLALESRPTVPASGPGKPA